MKKSVKILNQISMHRCVPCISPLKNSDKPQSHFMSQPGSADTVPLDTEGSLLGPELFKAPLNAL